MPEVLQSAVEPIPADRLHEVRPLLLELLAEDQGHYSAPSGRIDVEALVGEVGPSFTGENLVLGVRDAGALVGFCWCVFFDPGTGYEAEVAEVYVDPAHRRQGIARRLVTAAVEIFRSRGVTFAAVWTHPDNEAALGLYRSAGFAATEQTVLTWLPEGQ